MVVCGNDFMAVAAIQFLGDQGRGDLPVLGYDNYTFNTLKKLSTIAINFTRMKCVAVQRLRQQSGMRFNKLLPQLIIRKAHPHEKREIRKHVFQVFNVQTSSHIPS